MEEKPISFQTLFYVYLALMFLLALTIAASFLHLGHWGIVVSLLIAVAKAALVLLFFMKLRYESASLRLVAWASLLWIILLFGLTFGDYLTRTGIGVLGK